MIQFYINEQKLREGGSTGDFMGDMFFGEALHRLNITSPYWYNRLKEAAENDPEVMRGKDAAFARAAILDGYKGNTRTTLE